VLALAVPLAFVVGTGVWQRLILVGVILFLIAVELINTAVEKLSDHVTATHHPEIGKIKDMTSAAVGVAIAIAGLTWLVALGERVGLW
jgi:diacylglycerol kinase (ATP)